MTSELDAVGQARRQLAALLLAAPLHPALGA